MGAEFTLDDSFNDFFQNQEACVLARKQKEGFSWNLCKNGRFPDAFYLKALKARTLIIKDYKEAFKHYDLLLPPAMPITAPKIDDISKLTPLQNYTMDVLIAGSNLGGAY